MNWANFCLIVFLVMFSTGIGMIAVFIMNGDHDETGIPLQDGWDNPVPSKKKDKGENINSRVCNSDPNISNSIL